MKLVIELKNANNAKKDDVIVFINGFWTAISKTTFLEKELSELKEHKDALKDLEDKVKVLEDKVKELRGED